MPIYQYQCRDCGHQMEALQKMSEPRLEDCPACGARALRKQLTAAAFNLKGTGWYATDFKNSGARPTNQNASKGESESGAEPGASASSADSEAKDKTSNSAGASS